MIAALGRFSADGLRAAAEEVWLSTMVCAVVWLLAHAMRGRWPALQQALWALVFLRLLLPPGLAQPYGIGALLRRVDLGFERLGDDDVSVARAASSARLAGRDEDEGAGWPVLAMALWAAGVGLVVVRDRRASRRHERLLRCASAVEDLRALRTLERWRRRLGVRRPVQLLTADVRVSPFTIGWWRPIIFVPASLLCRGRRLALAAAIGHELAHVARWDCLWLALQQWLGRLYFFHPAVWIAARRLDAGRERMCDALVVSQGLLSARRYVGGLLDVLRLDLQRVEAPALTSTQRRILMRMQTVLAVKPEQRSHPLLALALAVAVGALLLPPVGGAPPAPSPRPAASVVADARALVNPLASGRLTRRFGPSADPFSSARPFHAGVDLAAPLGTPIVAPADGVVELATASYPVKSVGTILVLDHGRGMLTRYAHLDSAAVKVGQRVARGEVVARVGNTGKSTGPHLHFEVWEDEKAVDPATLIPEWAARRQ